MEILKLESIDKLRKFVKESEEFELITEASFQDIIEQLSLETIELKIAAFDQSNFCLGYSDVNSSSVSGSDVILSPKFYKEFESLSPALATDERLWTTLALGRFNEYTRARYANIPIEDAKRRNWILAHWLCGNSNRNKFRDNSISRLWWMGRVSYSIPGWSAEKVAELMIPDTDFRLQLMDRTSSSTALNVSKAILQIKHDLKLSGRELKREQFRLAMKEINFIAGRTNLAILSDTQVAEVLTPIFNNV